MISIDINGISYHFPKIPKGMFVMGANDFMNNAAPPHNVKITQDYFMLETCVTQRLWYDVMGTDIIHQQSLKGNDILYGEGDDLPMYYVNWFEANTFIDNFNKIIAKFHPELIAGLPTEAEWEYACRAGSYSPFYWGDGLNGTQANCNGNHPYGIYESGPFAGRVLPVKSYAPNKFGLYEMLGNVWEWCGDYYDPNYYKVSPLEDPKGPEWAEHKVIRGGGWRSFAWCCRSAFRDSDPPEYRGRTLGFRIVLKEKIL